MPASIGSIVVSLGLDAAQYIAGIDKVDRDTKRALARVKDDIDGIARTVGIGLALAGAAALKFGHDVIEGAANLDDMAEKTGASVEELSKFAQQARISGTSMESVEGALIQLSKHLQGAGEDSKNTGRALAALGLKAEELKGLDTAQAMKVIADQLNRFADGSGKSALAMDLLGKAGAQALPFLKDLANDQALAVNVTAKQAAEAEELGKSMRRLVIESENVKREFLLGLVPAAQRLIEQFREGKEIAGGFWEALALFSGINPFRTTGESAANLRKTLAEFKEARADLASRGVETGTIDAQIAGFEKKLKFALLMQRQEALALSGGDTPGELQRFGLRGSKQTLDYKSVDDGKDAARKLEELKQLRDETNRIAATIDAPSVPLFLDNETVEKAKARLTETKKLLSDGQKGWVAYAESVFAASDAELTAAGVGKSFTQVSEEITDRVLSTIDPLYALKRANDELTKSFEEGALRVTAEQLAFAKLNPEVRALLQSESNIFDKIQKDFEAGNLSIEQMNEAILRAQKGLDKTDDFAKQLGLTFSSAFEDAIISGKKFGDVLKSLALDIAKMIFRKNVTTPIANAVGGIDFGGILKGIFGGGSGGGVIDESGAAGIGSGFFGAAHGGGIVGALSMTRSVDASVFHAAPRFHSGGLVGGERAIVAKDGEGIFTPQQMRALSPASSGTVINLYPTIHIDSRTDAAYVRQEVSRGMSQAVAAIPGQVRRGGAYRKAVRG